MWRLWSGRQKGFRGRADSRVWLGCGRLYWLLRDMTHQIGRAGRAKLEMPVQTSTAFCSRFEKGQGVLVRLVDYAVPSR